MGKMGCMLLTAVLLAACEFERPAPSLTEIRPADGPDQESWGVHTYISHVPRLSAQSYRRVEIIAGYMGRYEQGDSSYQVLRSAEGGDASDVLIHLYDARGDSSATLTAARVVYYEKQQRFEASGNVQVVTPDGSRLETEALTWSENDRKLRTNRFVHITTARETVQGRGLVAEEDLSSYQIGRFTARLDVGRQQ